MAPRITASGELPMLGWQHRQPFDPELLKPIDTYGGGLIGLKPGGGLWTSPLTYDADGWVTGTEWTQWCAREDFRDPSLPIVEIRPHHRAFAVVIDGVDDLVELERLYPRPGVSGYATIPWIDWAAIDADAVWLTKRGEAVTRYSRPSLYGWDCETVLWLRHAFDVGMAINPTPPGGPLARAITS